MEREGSLSPRPDGTLDFFGTYLQSMRVAEANDQLAGSAEPAERLAAYLELRHLAVSGISPAVRRSAQEKLDSFVSWANKSSESLARQKPQVKNGHLEAAAIALAGVGDVPAAINLIKDGPRTAAMRAIEGYLETFPTEEDYLGIEP